MPWNNFITEELSVAYKQHTVIKQGESFGSFSQEVVPVSQSKLTLHPAAHMKAPLPQKYDHFSALAFGQAEIRAQD